MQEKKQSKPVMCVVCGERFFTKYRNKRYCSARCKQEAYRKRLMKRSHPFIGEPNMIKVNGVLMSREDFFRGKLD